MTQDNLDDVRAAFERWISEDGKWPAAAEQRNGAYLLAYTASAWTVWQAAVTAMREQRPRDWNPDWERESCLGIPPY